MRERFIAQINKHLRLLKVTKLPFHERKTCIVPKKSTRICYKKRIPQRETQHSDGSQFARTIELS